MAISEVCKFEVHEEVKKIVEQEGITKAEAFRRMAEFYSAIGVEVKEKTIEQKYYRAEKSPTNVGSNQIPTQSQDENDFISSPVISNELGKYEELDETGTKRCLKCGKLWAADLDYCPYCHLSPELRKHELRKSIKKIDERPHVSYNTGENEWYTPPEYIQAALSVLGEIDLDPASSEIANRTVKAKKFYDKASNGLTFPWAGKVWMNPPYASDLIKQFSHKFTDEVTSGYITEGIVLVNNATETGWFEELINMAQAIVFTSSRVKFLDPKGRPGAPLQGQAIIYFGENMDVFFEHFGKFGWGAVIR